MNELDELRKTLRQFLNEKDMGLERAAIYFNLSASVLSRFLNDKCKPAERTKYKIRKGLGLIKEESARLG